MSDLRQAARQALEAMLNFPDDISDAMFESITALKAALAQEQEQAEPVQEPVAWRYQDARGNYRYRGYVQGFDKEYSRLKPVPLYTTPPQRPPLADEEIRAHADKHLRYQPQSYEASGVFDLARAIERKVRGE